MGTRFVSRDGWRFDVMDSTDERNFDGFVLLTCTRTQSLSMTSERETSDFFLIRSSCSNTEDSGINLKNIPLYTETHASP